VKDTRVDFPVIIENDHAIWRAFNNEAWPALYFVDAKGRIRHHLFGEGEYQQSELILQQLLQEAGAGEQDHRVVAVDPQGAEAMADWNDLLSAENYLGYERTENFSSGGAKRDKRHDYTAPDQLKLNHWALSGNWTVGKEAVVLNNGNGQILYQFHARDLHLVMGPAVPGTRARFRVLIDGKSPAPLSAPASSSPPPVPSPTSASTSATRALAPSPPSSAPATASAPSPSSARRAASLATQRPGASCPSPPGSSLSAPASSSPQKPQEPRSAAHPTANTFSSRSNHP
jgi:hypothetical protein